MKRHITQVDRLWDGTALRVTRTRWLKRLVGVELWLQRDGGVYHYVVVKGGRK